MYLCISKNIYLLYYKSLTKMFQSDDSCPAEHRQNPRSSSDNTKDDDFSDQSAGDAVQLKPQKMNIKLRPGLFIYA